MTIRALIKAAGVGVVAREKRDGRGRLGAPPGPARESSHPSLFRGPTLSVPPRRCRRVRPAPAAASWTRTRTRLMKAWLARRVTALDRASAGTTSRGCPVRDPPVSQCRLMLLDRSIGNQGGGGAQGSSDNHHRPPHQVVVTLPRDLRFQARPF